MRDAKDEKGDNKYFKRIYRGRSTIKVNQNFFIGLEKMKNNSKDNYFSWKDFSELTGISLSTLKTIVKEYFENPEIFKNRLEN